MKKPYLIAIVCAALALGLLIWGFRPPPLEAGEAEPPYVLVLTEDKGTEVMQLKLGAQTAADELGIALEIYTTEQNAAADGQLLAWFAQWEDAEMSALILPQCPQSVLDGAAELADQKQIPWVLVSQESERASACVLDDAQAQGRLLGEAVAAGGGRPLIAYLEDTPQARARLQGVEAVLGQIDDVRIGAPSATLTFTDMPPFNACLIALTPAWTQALNEVEMIRSARPSPPLWGMDPGDGRVELLKHRAGGLLMEMPYARGYLAVMAAYDCAAQPNPPRSVTVPARVVTRDTMYQTENIKLVFPLLQ